jgi:hypothetical protein
MSLSFQEKSNLNLKLLDEMSLRLVDKQADTLFWPGKVYNRIHPADQSLMGSIGHYPNPDFSGFQAPNAMGMVLLVTPNEKGNVSVSVSGQFDVFHRQIPELSVMRKNLTLDGDDPKSSQTILTSYRRCTVSFKNIPLDLSVPNDINKWITPNKDNGITTALTELEGQCLSDPSIFKLCKLGKSGSAIFYFDWDDEYIDDQEKFNEVVSKGIFDDLAKVMPYQVNLRLRVRPAPNSLSANSVAYLLEVYLENRTILDEAKRYGINTNAHLLDSRFDVKLIKGANLGLPHKLEPADYRYKNNETVCGYGITTSVEQLSSDHFATNSMPISSLEKTRNPNASELGFTKDLTFTALQEDPLPILTSFVGSVQKYANEWQQLIDTFLASGDFEEANVASVERSGLLQEESAMMDGINLLSENPHLLQAFKWMNEVMEKAFIHQGKPEINTWRLFQIGFILTQVRAIYERTCNASEITDHMDTAECLWFQTGGGKTEAYLGIIIMGMLHERIQQRLYGTTAWMKFPLRMLSVQQFQRLSYVVAQANRIRERESSTLSGHPFTIGYYTGEGTPSRISSHYDSYQDTFLPNLTLNQLKKWQFVHDCPYCQSTNSISIASDITNSRIKHVCSNKACWSNTSASLGEYGEGIRGELGIFVSDEEVYRYQPTVLVGTIDKLAVIAHNKKFRVFFGGATHYCPQHGFSFEGKCTHSSFIRQDNGDYKSGPCGNNTRTSEIRTKSLKPMIATGIQFIIQDELHLLSENTGNFDAHYETLMMTLQEANGGRPPKILSATATIKGYQEHINHLYQKKARRFPAPGFVRGESFYSRIDTNPDGSPLIRRMYAGIFPLGAGSVTERATAITSCRFLSLIDELRSGLVNNTQETTQRLGFAPSKAKPLLKHIETYLNSCLLYNNSIRGNSDLHRALEEYQLVDYPDRRWLKLDGSTSLNDIQSAIQLIETKTPDEPTRQILATSVVSHGVDMHRLNFMIVGGWPKSISEYMQTSARAGRVEPGIVLSIMNSKNLFQSNVYLDFQDYHRFMDRMIESVPINRFAPNLLERTLPGIFSACINNWATGQSWGKDISKNAGKVRDALNDPALGIREQLKSLMLASLSVPDHIKGEFDHRVISDFNIQLERKIDWALNAFEGMSSSITSDYLSDAIERLLGSRPMRSLRDIETQIQVKPVSGCENLLDALSRNT